MKVIVFLLLLTIGAVVAQDDVTSTPEIDDLRKQIAETQQQEKTFDGFVKFHFDRALTFSNNAAKARKQAEAAHRVVRRLAGLYAFHSQEKSRAGKKYRFHVNKYRRYNSIAAEQQKRLVEAENRLKALVSQSANNQARLQKQALDLKRTEQTMKTLETSIKRYRNNAKFHYNLAKRYKREQTVNANLAKQYKERANHFQKQATAQRQKFNVASQQAIAHTAEANRLKSDYAAKLATNNANQNNAKSKQALVNAAASNYHTALEHARASFKLLKQTRQDVVNARHVVNTLRAAKQRTSTSYKRLQKIIPSIQKKIAKHDANVKLAQSKLNSISAKRTRNLQKLNTIKSQLNTLKQQRKQLRTAMSKSQGVIDDRMFKVRRSRQKTSNLHKRHRYHVRRAAKYEKQRRVWNDILAHHTNKRAKNYAKLRKYLRDAQVARKDQAKHARSATLHDQLKKRSRYRANKHRAARKRILRKYRHKRRN